MEHFVFPEIKWRPALRCIPGSQIIGGDTDEDHTQIIGGETVKLFGAYIPPSPLGFCTPGPNGKSQTMHFQVLVVQRTHRRSQDFRLGGGANHKSHAMTLS